MTQSKTQKIIKDTSGEEVAMIRVDKTLKDIMEDKPASRWDVDYWHPKYDNLLAEASSKLEVVNLYEILTEPIIAPDHVRASKKEKIGQDYECEYRTLKDLKYTGLNYAKINYCSDNAYKRLKRSELKVDDILFAGSGIGAIGRVGVVEEISKKSCVGDLFIIRNIKIEPYYLYVYFLTQFGQSQIEKIFHGIQSAKINSTEIGHIKVVILNDKVQKNIKNEYKKMSNDHYKAMQAKKSGNEAEYKKHIGKAEKMLKDLIARTEAVIRGEREDVI